MKNTVAVIDFGTSKIVTVVAQEKTTDQLTISGSGVAAYDGFNEHGEWNTPRQMVQRVHASIAAAEKDSGTPIKEVYVGVPGAFINVRCCTVTAKSENGERAEELMNTVMDMAADELGIRERGQLVLHRSPAWYRKDGGEKTFAPYGECNELEGQISYILAQECFLEDVSEMLGVLGITILGFASPTYGADMLLLQTDERDEGAVVVDCGFGNTDVTVVQGDAISYHVILPFGGMDLMRELVYGLRVSARDAEKIKRGCGFDDDEYQTGADFRVYDERTHELLTTIPRAEVNAIVKREVDSGLDMLKEVLDEDAAQFLGRKAKIVLIGGGIAKMTGAAERVALATGYDCEIGKLKASRLNGPEYASVMGLVDVVMDAAGLRRSEYAPPEKKKLFGKK